jgi:diaminobutyrate-2-oxoglutarate transaminase
LGERGVRNALRRLLQIGLKWRINMDFKSLSFPEAPLIKIQPPGPRSKEYLSFQSAHEGSAVSYPRGMPMALSSARGATVEDVDGNVYIDFFGGAGVMNVGHSNPMVLEDVSKQLSRLTHSLDFPSEPRKALIDTLFSLFPDPLKRVLFGGPTGSDAVEAAVKLAKYNTHRHPLISFEGAYHGMSAGALSLSSGLSFKEDFLPLIPEVHFAPYAYCYRCAFGKTSESCDLDCVKYVEHVLEDPHSGVGKPAAIIIEAIQGEGGSIVPPEKFLTGIRKTCDKNNVIMIVDEIQAGLGRTGKMFAFEHSGIVPDIITLSKGLGGLGFPISCIAYKEKLDTFPAGKHIGTSFNLGEKMLSWLKGIEKDSSIVGEVRGRGLMLGIELVKDKASKEPAPDLAQRVRTICHQHGLLVEIGGHYSNVVRFLPPLVLTEELAKKGTEIFADSIRKAEKAL